MTYIEQAIKEAVKGGYDDDFGVNTPRFKEYEHWQIRNQFQMYCLDPLFWQALGKARGWIDANYPNGEMRCENKLGRCEARYCEYGGYKNPKQQAMYFFDHIMDGKDAESFFKELLSNK